jgi:hypothetical protein
MFYEPDVSKMLALVFGIALFLVLFFTILAKSTDNSDLREQNKKLYERLTECRK